MSRPHPEHPPEPPSGEQTRIIRRAPTAPVPVPADDTRTGIIRRAPTEPVPVPHADAESEFATTALHRSSRNAPARSGSVARRGPGTAVAACVTAMLSGWTTSVVATDLITGWWDTDRLFCAAVGFLALVFAASTISGVVLLLLRRAVGRYLIAVGAVVALLAFSGVFIAGASIPWIVYAMPLLPVASGVLALLPTTRDWATTG